MIVYETFYALQSIKKVEAIKETEKSFVIKPEKTSREQRVAKISDWGSYHHTFSEAKQALILDSKSKMETALATARCYEEKMKKAEKIQE